MQFSISDDVVSQFLSGVFAILALIAVGGILTLILGGMAKRFPFSRLALVFALTPLSLLRFMERGASSTLFLYATIVLLLGITIDGISHLLEPKANKKTDPQVESEVKATEEPGPGVIVWEKAE